MRAIVQMNQNPTDLLFQVVMKTTHRPSFAARGHTHVWGHVPPVLRGRLPRISSCKAVVAPFAYHSYWHHFLTVPTARPEKTTLPATHPPPWVTSPILPIGCAKHPRPRL